jgi:hypothetical protein
VLRERFQVDRKYGKERRSVHGGVRRLVYVA